jgi:phosphatidylglycerophosphatase A
MNRLALLVATSGYVGFAPFASGTAGAAVGLGVYALVRLSDNVLVEAVVLIAVFAVGTWAAELVERQLGKDPSAVVVDEVLGMLMSLAFLGVTPLGALVGFLLFRVLDVIKPYPAWRLEHMHGGAGIMLDDAVAGLYSNLLLRGLIAFFPGALA